MATSGDLIRMLNYVDDIAATLRRVRAMRERLSAEEKLRLAEHMRTVEPNYLRTITELEQEAGR